MEMLPQILGSVAGGLLGGGDQQQTQSRDPWGAAQPWMKANIATGQNLQDYYTKNPFSQAQQTGHGNSFGLSNAYRSLLPSLLDQMSGQTGFNRANPLSRPPAYNFSAASSNLGFSPQTVNRAMFQNPLQNAAPATPATQQFTNPWLQQLQSDGL